MDSMLEKIFVMEIEKQCDFGLLCYNKMNEFFANPLSVGTTEFWFYAQAFLVSAANISKILWGVDKPRDKKKRYKQRKPLRKKLGISDKSVLNNRTVRNCFEHFDEKIDIWFSSSKNKVFVDSNIGPENMIGNLKKSDHLRFYDTEKNSISFRGIEFPVKPVVLEMIKLKEKIKLYKSQSVT